MAEATNLVLVPGLLCTKALWAPQLAALGDIAAMRVADHTRHDSMAAIAESILAVAPERFALAGLSMGGFISFEIVRQAAAARDQAGSARHQRAPGSAGATSAALGAQ